jgi:hypothetical protein
VTSKPNPLAAVRAWPGIARSQENLVKKQSKEKSVARRQKVERELEQSGPLDWTPMFQAFKEAFDWALDVGAGLARDYPEEVEAVERVRAFMHKRIKGEAAHVRIDDVLFTFALIIGAIERDLGPVANLGPWFAAPMRFPSIEELWNPPLRRHVLMTIHPSNRSFA